MHRIVQALCGFALVCALPAAAQSYPTKPIRLIIGFPAGGGTDVTARTITQPLIEKFGQPIVIDYRPGAAGTVGNGVAAKSTPDGYTWLMTATGPHVIAPSLYRSLPYDPFRDYAPIGLVSTSPYLLLVHPSVEARSVAELVRWLRARPTPANYSSAGAGTPGHLASELFKSMTKVSIDHIPYKGAAPALVDLMGGQVQMGFSDMTISAPHLKSGRLRALAISSSTRSPLAPDLPTVAESGLPGFEALVWYGLLGPTGTPSGIVRQINAEVVRVLKLPETQQRFAALGATASPGTPEAFAAQIKRDYDKWAGVIKSAGITLE
ncbi:MAG: Bug family tripartite tricarboxylate transporter substrate binding protein [Burkholderiales bacterium]